ncbi:DUF1056 family protein [Bacillus licheniformis]|uniref:DUF1056 family protein n=2 Tax=Bacillus licheniformis TaxID=1402 RepID=A0A8B5YIJ9_BACLI|nr:MULTISPECIES: DUF1056 family protein [Bacillus]MBY8348011.1 DUF1056 family protein [Bacillus sp. PCH94]AAU25071.1 hypothetical phagelike protein [Bacillus licheniformis DSM 13 = ATCC 14580]AAU42440.1 phage related protein [Bacillus licheniformis DSM 13 = ATCC 14580]AKQ74876.1 phage-like protein [Bacillus licheniformis WX-02]ARC60436.1 hypothetical protein BaDB11_01794 [Bacillus licheniformis]
MKILKTLQLFLEDILLIAGMVFISIAIYRINVNAGLIATGVFLFSLASLAGFVRQKNKDEGGK